MSLFSSRKSGRDTAAWLISGHTALIAYWTLRHAGVLDAMAADPEGIDPSDHAARTNMAPDVLEALLAYLARHDLVTLSGGRAHLTAASRALMEHEDGVLEFLRAYQPVTASMEHLLARLKVYGTGVFRRNDALVESQNTRWAGEVLPALQRAVLKSGATHVLDLNCGSGELLLRLARATPKLAAVGICPDGATARSANDAIAREGLDKRLLVVTGNALDVCTDTRNAFERIGISTQFWNELDCLVACGQFSELAARDRTTALATLTRLPKAFPRAALVLAEPCAGPPFDKNYYAAEMELLLKLSRCLPLPPEQWRDLLTQARFEIAAETSAGTDGVCIFTARPARKDRPAGSPGPAPLSAATGETP